MIRRFYLLAALALLLSPVAAGPVCTPVCHDIAEYRYLTPDGWSSWSWNLPPAGVPYEVRAKQICYMSCRDDGRHVFRPRGVRANGA